MTICCFFTCLVFLFFLSSIARIHFEFPPLQCSLSGNSALAAWNPWSSGPGSRTNCIAFKSGYLRISQVLTLESLLPLERLAQALVSKGSGSHLHGLVRPFGHPLSLATGWLLFLFWRFDHILFLCFSEFGQYELIASSKHKSAAFRYELVFAYVRPLFPADLGEAVMRPHHPMVA
ncbi:hypothetical protein BKA61DRAFT_273225 [Leptodontidium sp. MPI-SDFR-AT-0119]|nr:hypothetical protein BKA61DRAFT_273225 [Leptodontidium sp. MPI-SDFR-AT-0119]